MYSNSKSKPDNHCVLCVITDSSFAPSFYPLFPTALGDALDADQMAYLQLSVKPDFLVLPSQLKHFAKVRPYTLLRISTTHVLFWW
jgi:hypothetical protein